MIKDSEANLNVVQIFLNRVSRYSQRTGLLHKSDGTYRAITWRDWAQRVRACALGLYALGVRKGDRIGILSSNRPEWSIADLAILSLGAVVVPIYPTSSPADVSYIVANAGMKFLFISDGSLLVKAGASLAEARSLARIILFERSPQDAPRIMTFSELLDTGRRTALNNPLHYEAQVEQVHPEDWATIIYTSGTTGPPKGVVLSHSNFIQNYLGAKQKIKIREGDVALSFLPLSHVFERLAGYYFMMACGATIAYAEGMQTVAEDMLVIRPTVAAAVPRFYEKVYNRILEKVQPAGSLRHRIFTWAVSVGQRVAKARREGRAIAAGLRVEYAVATVLIFEKLKKSLGGRIRFFISGGAPLNKELAEFFYAAGVLILEGYGLTETSPVIAANSEEEFRFGTVGRPLSNCETRIAEDGEILTRGPCVMQGYYKDPEATQAAIRDGWFHTGDIGEFDLDGFLKITDRKKDIIKTSGGKMISPQNIEKEILGDPLFSQAVVLGDRRHYLVALLVPNREEVLAYGRSCGLAHLGWEDLLRREEIHAHVAARLKKKIAGFASYEQIKFFALLPREFTQDSGELTPTLKVKRRVVEEKYRTTIDSLYAEQPLSQTVS